MIKMPNYFFVTTIWNNGKHLALELSPTKPKTEEYSLLSPSAWEIFHRRVMIQNWYQLLSQSQGPSQLQQHEPPWFPTDGLSLQVPQPLFCGEVSFQQCFAFKFSEHTTKFPFIPWLTSQHTSCLLEPAHVEVRSHPSGFIMSFCWFKCEFIPLTTRAELI